MIEMTTTCRECGREHSPTHADYVAGRWHTCTDCRDGPQMTNDPNTGANPATGQQTTLRGNQAKLARIEKETDHAR